MVLTRLATILILIVILFSSNFIFIKDKFFGSSDFLKNEIVRLELENDSLKARLFINENLSGKEIKENTWEYFSTKVFSSYPFNNQNLITINSGKNSGVQVGQSVALMPGVLLGQVIKVGENSSLVKTVFDKDFIAAVKIGNSGIDGLLKGGLPPALEMIEKNKEIKNGDIVYNADKNFPYGFKFGEIQIISGQDASDPFKKAYLKTGYSSVLIEEVFVIRNFKVIKND